MLVLVLSLATMVLVYGSSTELGRMVRADVKTRLALHDAVEALIGRAIADSNRPGSLPCPDNDNDGSADLFTGSACPSYLGRLPWRTLGVGDLRDATGERLWYALSPPFRDHPSAPPLNADTRGTLTVYSASKARVLTEQAIAVVFSPGLALAAQQRDASVAFCDARSKHVARSHCPGNYLEAHGEIDNAAASGPFIASPTGTPGNDKLAVITAADLMSLVERRVALEAREALLAYRNTSTCGCYPWADASGDGKSDIGAHQGRIPLAALPEAWRTGVLPPYFAANQWSRVVYYAVARDALHERGTACETCSGASLTLDAHPGYDVLLITPGYAQDKTPRTSWADFLDDVENHNGDERFVTPTAAVPERDRVYAVAGAAAGCAVHARVLVDNAPCRGPAGAIRTACTYARAALAPCGCSAAAAAMTVAPCADGSALPACEQAMVQLRRCS